MKYCDKCGYPLDDGAEICSHCGNPVTTEEAPAPEVEEKVPTHIEFDWSADPFEEKKEEAPAAPEVPAIPETPAAEEQPAPVIQVEKMETRAPRETLTLELFEELRQGDELTKTIDLTEELRQEGDEPVTLEGIQEDIDRTANLKRQRDTDRLDKFFTFNQKNEEFQKLLDQEYERIHSGRTDEPTAMYKAGEIIAKAELAEQTLVMGEAKEEIKEALEETKDVVEEAAETAEKEIAKESKPFNPVEHLKEAEKQRNAALGIAVAEEVISEVAPAEEKIEESAVPVEEVPAEETPAEEADGEIIFNTMELEKDLMASATALAKDDSHKGGFKTVEVEELLAQPEEVEESIEEKAEVAAAALGLQSALSEFTKETPESEPEKAEEEIPEEPLTREQMIDNLFGAVGAAAATEAAEETPAEPEAPAEEKTEAPSEEAPASDEPEAEEVPVEPETPETSEIPETPVIEEEPKKGKGCLVGFIIILVIALIGLGAYGAQKFGLLDGIFGGGEEPPADPIEIEDPIDEPEPEPEPEPQIDYSVPIADKNLILQGIGYLNHNINSITVNDSLCYSEDATYSNDKVKSTVPLDNNILAESEDGTVYLVDQTCLEALITYDSAWIDYVNRGDKTIFTVLKPGSNAYKNTEAFKQKVTKTFNSLEIGEIRQDENGYYVWTDEKITTTSNGSSTTSEFHWVYYMEPDGNTMKIVDYYKF